MSFPELLKDASADASSLPETGLRLETSQESENYWKGLTGQHLVKDPVVFDQVQHDLEVLDEEAFAVKYPNLAPQYILTADLPLYKKKLAYLFEQSIVYLNIGGYGDSMEELEGDLVLKQPPETVVSSIVTLRSDILSTTPNNDLDSETPYMEVWDNDDKVFKTINIRRVHHMWDFQLRKWNANQHWLMDKLSRFTASIEYYSDLETAKVDHPLYATKGERASKNTIKTVVTLDPKLIPSDVNLDQHPLAAEEPAEARWDVMNPIKFWDVTNKKVVDIVVHQILDMEINESKVPPAAWDGNDELLPDNRKPSNWREMQNGKEKIAKFD